MPIIGTVNSAPSVYRMDVTLILSLGILSLYSVCLHSYSILLLCKLFIMYQYITFLKLNSQ